MIKALKKLYWSARHYLLCKFTKIENKHTIEEYAYSNQNNIIFILNSAETGGAPLLGKHIINAFKEKGYNVFIVIMSPGLLLNELVELGFVYFPLGSSDLVHFIKKHKLVFERAYCNSALTGIYVSALKNMGIRPILLIHEMKDVLAKCLKEREIYDMFKNASSIIFPSTLTRDSVMGLIDKDIESFNKILVKPQGLYLTKYRDIDKKSAKLQLERKLELQPGRKVVINVATSNHRKGFDIFVKLASECCDFNFIWVGYNLTSFAKSSLESLGNKPSNLYLLGYIKTAEELETIYEAADVLALTSREEPFGSVVLEAFSFGTPVVAFNNCGGYVDVVKNGITGLLVDGISVSSMQEGIFSLLNEKDLESFSIQCRSLVKEMGFDKYIHFLDNI